MDGFIDWSYPVHTSLRLIGIASVAWWTFKAVAWTTGFIAGAREAWVDQRGNRPTTQEGK